MLRAACIRRRTHLAGPRTVTGTLESTTSILTFCIRTSPAPEISEP
jgi:hypothetical protein